MSACAPEVRVVVRHKGFAALQISVSASPSSEPAKLSRRIGWGHATREFDVLLLAFTVWAFLTDAFVGAFVPEIPALQIQFQDLRINGGELFT
ncbi:MAG: hypothetical protein ABSH39_08895 [Candidatus Acidiferrum sp.]